MIKKFCVLLMLPVVLAGSVLNISSAQDLPGQRDSVNSAILKEKRVIQVVLPQKYKQGSTDKYDVLYVLDGDWNTKLVSQVQRFMEDEAKMPPAIIVGILNTDRDRDFLPTHVADNKTSGGADKFLSFLKNELIPYVDKTYPADGDNTLFGHSFGGVFVTYALLNEPQLFNSYIAADPSFWWDKNTMDKQVEGKMPALANLNKTLFITGREGQGMTEMGINQMEGILKKSVPAGLSWKISAYPDETHGSVRLKSMYDGLKYSYN
ncbi:MAG: alpha/beta hydrolase, partial [Mucilaginibacter sp.]